MLLQFEVSKHIKSCIDNLEIGEHEIRDHISRNGVARNGLNLPNDISRRNDFPCIMGQVDFKPELEATTTRNISVTTFVETICDIFGSEAKEEFVEEIYYLILKDPSTTPDWSMIFGYSLDKAGISQLRPKILVNRNSGQN